MSEKVGSNAHIRVNIVEKILEQGQRLRNAMVKSILDSDPFYIDVVGNGNSKSLHIKSDKSATNLSNCHKITGKQKGPTSTTWDELSIVDSPKAMSTDYSEIYCGCEICSIYRDQTSLDNKQQIPPLHLLQRRKVHPILQTSFNSYDSEDAEPVTTGITGIHIKNVSDNYPKQVTECSDEFVNDQAKEYFKHVNSLKIVIHNLNLNQAGNRKATVSSADPRLKLPTSISHNYFIEYAVPDSLNNSQQKSKSKVDSGLSANLFRICSKKLHNEDIYFKHTSIHDIVSPLQLNLQDIEIKFQVSSRTMKQKRANILGYATFNMSSFETAKYLSCTENFAVVGDSFKLGTLKITLQLGYGRMYFGKELIEFVDSNKKIAKPILSERSDHPSVNTSASQTVNSVIYVNNISDKKSNTIQSKSSDNLQKEKASMETIQQGRNLSANTNRSKMLSLDRKSVSEGIGSSIDTHSVYLESSVKENTNFAEQIESTTTITDSDNLNKKTILYGLIYISEAQYFDGPINSYLSCQVFCQGDTLCSRVVYHSKQPVFNFYQKVPFLYDDSFVQCMRDNSIVVDFWERYEDEDIAIGTSQLSLHQFFVTYRNPVITKSLIQNRLPVTISDWWEPICSPVDGKLYGQMKVLVAVGTAAQIHNLEVERGLKDNSFSVTYVPIVPEACKKDKSDKPDKNDQVVNSFKRPNYLNKTKNSNQNSATSTTVISKSKEKKSLQLDNTTKSNKQVIKVNKIDVGIQSNMDVESQNKTEQNSENNTQNILETFLTHLVEQKQKNIYVENATNTETSDIHNNISKNLNNEKQDQKLNQCRNNTNVHLRKTSDLLDYLNGTLQNKPSNTYMPHSVVNPKEDENNFKAHVIVEGALHLPSKRKSKVRKMRKKNTCEDALPSTYVTFETIPGADLKITPTVPRSTNPHWDFRCDVLLPGEILTNSQKRLIFKVWKKTNINSLHPNLQTDVILGFAALDLTVLLVGLPSVQGWFNIVDFSSKCNGQIKIHITPLENISRFSESKTNSLSDSTDNLLLNNQSNSKQAILIETQEQPSELLNRALKRKFTELEEITQRLRTRLADVTKDDSDTSNDEFADEFEKDINTLCVEDDYNMIDLMNISGPQPFSAAENGTNHFLLKEVGEEYKSIEPSIYSKGIFHSESLPNGVLSDSAYGSTQAEQISQRYVVNNISSSNSSNMLDTNLQSDQLSRALTTGDRQLISGKQHIDTLLQKLSLLAGADVENSFPNRYVSGCSINQESNVQLTSNKDVSDESDKSDNRSGFNLDTILNPTLFNQLCTVDVSTPSLTEFSEGLNSSSFAQLENNSSSNSLLTQFSNFRQAPDGAGNNLENVGYFSSQNVLK